MNTNKIFHDWSSEVYLDRNNIVFEDKNQAYGAYQIRKEYNKVVFLSFTFAMLGILLVSGIPYVINYLKSQHVEKIIPDLDPPTIIPYVETITPEIVKPIVKKEIIIPTASTVKDIVPEVINKIKPDDDTYRKNSELVDKNGGTETKDGIEVLPNKVVFNDEKETEKKIEEDNSIKDIVQEMPSFIGGDAAMLNYIYKNIQYPETEKEIGISGTVYVYFVINQLGNVEGVKVLRGVKGGYGLDKEALRVISKMPTWKPGIQNGKPVKVQFTFPIKFNLK